MPSKTTKEYDIQVLNISCLGWKQSLMLVSESMKKKNIIPWTSREEINRTKQNEAKPHLMKK